MLDRVSGASFRAISSSATVRHQRQDSAEPLWFAVMCRELWGSNAPKELEFKTGRSDRTCRAWASGGSPPPVNILLMLLTDHECGERVLDYVMRDCDALWWRELQPVREMCADYKVVRRP
jgi:hypothetical protein